MPDELRDAPWHDAATEVIYQWQKFSRAKTPTEEATAIVDLSNAMSDLMSFVPGYDWETGTMPWEREE